MFELLIGVSGIGPKGALGILSALSMDTLRFAILCTGCKVRLQRHLALEFKTAQENDS